MKWLVVFIVVIGLSAASLSIQKAQAPVEKLFREQVIQLLHELEHFEEAAAARVTPQVLKEHFIASRLAYKRTSILVDYFFPINGRSINGPDLPYAEDDRPDLIHDPHGFQVIERIVYGEIDYELLRNECRQLVEIFKSMNEQPELAYKFRDELVFDALKSAVIRVMSLGLTGFDSPVALQSLPECEAVFTGIEDIITLFEPSAATQYIRKAKAALKGESFDNFDRLDFIKNTIDPLYGSLVDLSIRSRSLLPWERRPLNQFSGSLFSDSLFDINFFSPNDRYRMNIARTELGRSLFYDTIFTRSAQRSCATCHDPAKAFTDGLRVPAGLNAATKLKRNTPTLTGAAIQTRFFYDSRASTLENQLNAVVHNVDEMNGSLAETIELIGEHPAYTTAFRKAYPNDRRPVTDYNIANAISSYVRSLSSFNTKFDRYMRGQTSFSRIEKRGFNLFAGKAKCATCHFIPLFNGLVPPQFTETESEVLGVPSIDDRRKIDDDPGKAGFTKSRIHEHAFKTPTLRNIARTAPYMHNGVFDTLEQVMDFYNKGGGAAVLSVAPVNQTLPAEPLNLSKREIKSIIAFLGTLSE